MGAYYCCCKCCLSEDKRIAITINKEISNVIAEQMRRKEREVKLLLLGTGESGKTTFMKQIRMLHGSGYSEDERLSYTNLVFQNIFRSMCAMTNAMKKLKIPYSNPQNEIYAQCFQDLDIHQITQLQRSYVKAIHGLWADQGFMDCYKRRREYQLPDSTKYFIDNLDRIAAKDYCPTHQDILRVRTPSTGITEYCFSTKKVSLRIVDVGGQRGQRRKWIHCFENVYSLLFVASLSEYDQVLEENDKDVRFCLSPSLFCMKNRMEESLSLFYTTIHSPWFANSSVILFLNKMDVLAEKIQFSDLKTYFPGFEGKRGDVHDAMLFIRNLYTQKAVFCEEEKSKSLYCHFMCATDTTETCKLFSNIKDFIITEGLNEFKMV